MNQAEKTKFAVPLLISLMLAVFFLLSTNPVIEGDVFWHVKTGEWIVKHLSIPDSDIFTYTSAQPVHDSPGRDWYYVVLKQYWLSQPVFYFVYKLFGIAGIALFRALIITSILYILYAWMKRHGVGFGVLSSFLFLIGIQMRYQGDRPHYFSFLFFALTLILIEDLVDGFSAKTAERAGCAASRERASGFACPVPPLLLPLLMTLWANMHGGYVMGSALIAVYVAGDLIKRVVNGLKRITPVSDLPVRFHIICLTSIAATFVNPLTYRVYARVFSMVKDVKTNDVLLDYISPVTAFLTRGDYKPAYWILIILTFVIICIRARKMRISRVLALSIFAGESLLMQRNIAFFVLLMPLVAVEVNGLAGKRLKNALFPAAACLAALCSLLYVQFAGKGVMNFSLEKIYPVNAVEFIKETRPEGNLFNFVDWGGYLILYMPEYPVFCDGRRISTDIESVQYSVLSGSNEMIAGKPLWRAYLDAYKVDIVLVPAVTPIFHEFVPLVKELYRDKDFALVYSDSLSLVYLRKSRNEGIIERFDLPKRLSLVRAVNILGSYDEKANSGIISELNVLAAGRESGN